MAKVSKKVFSKRFNKEVEVEFVECAEKPELRLMSRKSVCKLLEDVADSTTLTVKYHGGNGPLYVMECTLTDDAGTEVTVFSSWDREKSKREYADPIDNLYLICKAKLARQYFLLEDGIYGEDEFSYLPSHEEEKTIAKKYVPKPVENKPVEKAVAAPAPAAEPEAEEDSYQELPDYEDLPFDADETPVEEKPAEKPAAKKNTVPHGFKGTKPVQKSAKPAPAKEETAKAESVSADNEAASYVIKFGSKHKDRTLSQVANEDDDMQYVKWLANNKDAKGIMIEAKAMAQKFLGIA